MGSLDPTAVEAGHVSGCTRFRTLVAVVLRCWLGDSYLLGSTAPLLVDARNVEVDLEGMVVSDCCWVTMMRSLESAVDESVPGHFEMVTVIVGLGMKDDEKDQVVQLLQ